MDANSTSTELLSFYNLLSSNVLPLTERSPGDYTVSFKFGNNDTVRSFNLDIDTGSDLTWVQCDFKKCQGCTMPKNKLYKLDKNKYVYYGTPLCDAVQKKRKSSTLPCEYQITYVDNLQVEGYLVKDSINIESSDAALRSTALAFGCTNKLKDTDEKQKIPFPEGILGLGFGKASILSQLKSQGLIKNVIGHCISGKRGVGGGYLFFGDKFIPKPPTEISWTPIVTPSKGHYFAGQADLLYNEIHTSIKGLNVMFDSGTTFSYLNSKDYKVLLNLINTTLNSNGTFNQYKAKKSNYICWKGDKPFNSTDEIINNTSLKPIILSFPKDVHFQLPVKQYIGRSGKGDICLLIENSKENGFNDDNVIGVLSMKDKIMIFDNERKRIGWVPDDCTKLPSHR